MFRAITELDAAQVETLTDWFDELWWTSGRTRADVEIALANSVVVAFEDDSRELAGFARVISDRVYKALILDVVVDPKHRGRGLGKRLMDDAMSHPDLAAVQHFELYCAPDMVEFYERWGFTRELGTLTFMRRVVDAR